MLKLQNVVITIHKSITLNETEHLQTILSVTVAAFISV